MNPGAIYDAALSALRLAPSWLTTREVWEALEPDARIYMMTDALRDSELTTKQRLAAGKDWLRGCLHLLAGRGAIDRRKVGPGYQWRI